MTYTKKEREQYNQQRERSCQRLGITKNQYNWLRRQGESLHCIYEWQCNGEDSQGNCSGKWPERWEKWENEHYSKTNEYVKKLGLFVYYQTDPRGATIYCDTKPIPDNNYNQSVCIY